MIPSKLASLTSLAEILFLIAFKAVELTVEKRLGMDKETQRRTNPSTRVPIPSTSYYLLAKLNGHGGQGALDWGFGSNN